ncbi:response regulator [Clostridium sp. MSJ-4]|uniref:Transcriptional regulatory protein n=1 Tax=Clostridium simiarum TaxID=2841506 RepID=A0ABS6F193_9CLOT|nr:response regulator [Clostridium simiarum]MBU5592276.1 response regulator [Clostridium simiarum]
MISVIVVDDDMMVADLNKSYVENIQGFEVRKVLNNGEDALRYLMNNEIDLMLLDVYMPGLGGMELLEEMKKNSIMTDVILVTAESDASNIDKILKLGVVDYLIKPFRYVRIKKSLEGYRLRYNLIHDKTTLKQGDIDKITTNNLSTSGLQKGISEKTLERIYKFMKENKGKIYTSELVAEKVSMSRVTTKKYLDYLASIGKVATKLEYKTVGRPLTLYKYHNESH